MKKYRSAVVSYGEGLKLPLEDQHLRVILLTNRSAAHHHLGESCTRLWMSLFFVTGCSFLPSQSLVFLWWFALANKTCAPSTLTSRKKKKKKKKKKKDPVRNYRCFIQSEINTIVVGWVRLWTDRKNTENHAHQSRFPYDLPMNYVSLPNLPGTGCVVGCSLCVKNCQFVSAMRH